MRHFISFVHGRKLQGSAAAGTQEEIFLSPDRSEGPPTQHTVQLRRSEGDSRGPRGLGGSPGNVTVLHGGAGNVCGDFKEKFGNGDDQYHQTL